MLNRIKNNPDVARAVANLCWLGLERLTQIGVAILVSGLLARYFGADLFGKWQYANTLLLVLAPLTWVCGAEILVPTIVHGGEQRVGTIIGSAFALRFAVSALALALTWTGIAAGLTEPTVGAMLAALAVTMLFREPLVGVINAWLQSMTYAKPQLITSMATALAKAAGIWLLVRAAAPPAGFAWLWAVEAAIIAAVLLVYYRVRRGRLDWRVERGLLRTFASTGTVFWLGLVCMYLFLKLDRLVLERYVSFAELGRYSAAQQLNENWIALALMLAQTLAPAFVYRVADVARLRRNMWRLIWMSTALMSAGALALDLAAGLVVRAVFGPGFDGAAQILRVAVWLSVPAGIEAIGNLVVLKYQANIRRMRSAGRVGGRLHRGGNRELLLYPAQTAAMNDADHDTLAGVTVLIPAYNCQADLERTLRSFDEPAPVRALVVDDGSTPPITAPVVDGMSIEILRLARNGGIEQALAAGIDTLAARGVRYAARIDAGDLARPCRLAKQAAYLDAHPRVAALGAWAQASTRDGAPLFTLAPPTEPADIRRRRFARAAFVHPAMMLRVDAVRQAGNYRAAYRAAEDLDLFLRLMRTHDCANLPEVALCYKATHADRLDAAAAARLLRAGQPVLVARPGQEPAAFRDTVPGVAIHQARAAAAARPSNMRTMMTNHGTILVTGGAGFIGSHTCVELLSAGYDVVVIDNLVNSKVDAVRRVEQITGKTVAFYEADARDDSTLAQVFERHPIRAAIHFAALKAVGESVHKPLDYYANNLDSLLALLRVMNTHDVKHVVFSSSATVYGVPQSVPIDETFPLSATNPYGQTKLMAEQILRDLAHTNVCWKVATLRYFNPVGAHESGLIGEDPNGIPNNLMPFVAQVAVGKLPHLRVFGGDYGTPDGTGVRDYIHVVDLARGHLAALDTLFDHGRSFTVNLGTGNGYSVLDVVRAFEQACGRKIPYEIVARRPGDVAACYTDPTAAERIIGWRAEHGIEGMCTDHWRWQANNPNGYA
ncbi:hypothetical protein DFQ28_008014 [Apophysomyces sp. BC1034]|nr:hypothetical protein DFQ28_008014 [Apophysomyces sp. BC1034]